MAVEGIERLFARKGVWRNSELVEARVQYRDLAEAIAAGIVVRPVFNRRAGHVRGVFVSRDLNMDPERGFIVASVLTGGVIGRHSAAFRYQMVTSLPPRVEVHVRDSYSRVPPAMPMVTMRSRNPDSLTVGVDVVDTEFGVQLAVTTPARTIVDILNSGRSVDRDHEHGMEAIEAFLQSGGEPGEIVNVAQALNLDPDGRIELVVGAVSRGMGARSW